MAAAENNTTSLDPGDRFQRLVEMTKAIPWELDLDTFGFTYVGPRAEAILGFPVEDWYQPDFWLNQLHPDDAAWAPGFCQDAMRRGADHEFEYRMYTADRRLIWIRDDVTVNKDKDGKPLSLQGFMFDISEQKIAENVMRSLARSGNLEQPEFYNRSVEQLAQVYGAKFSFIGLLNEDKQSVQTLAVWGDGELLDNFDYDLEGTPCKDVLDFSKELIPRDASKIYSSDKMLVDMGIDSYYGAPLIGSDNTLLGLVSVMDVKPMQLSVWSEPVLGVFASRIAVEMERQIATENLHRLNLSLERRVAERTEELQKTVSEMQTFCYSVSHDLRAPLRSINGYAHFVLEDCWDRLDESGRDYMGRIAGSTKKMAELIDDMLDLSRVSRAQLEPQQVSLASLARSAFSRCQQGNPQREVTFINKSRQTVRGDAKLLGILFDNLIENAWKYTGKTSNPTIEFDSFKQDSRHVYFIKDNGAGFDMRYANKLFQPFQRLHDNSEFEGNGIGLATVRRIVERHGGDIWAEASVGAGARFCFTL